eukprot:scaffold95285_cov29-Tisochrysis_lutea.AAC.2
MVGSGQAFCYVGWLSASSWHTLPRAPMWLSHGLQSRSASDLIFAVVQIFAVVHSGDFHYVRYVPRAEARH